MSDYLKIIRLTAPSFELVSLEEAKKQLQVDFDDDDGFISGLIPVARDKCEQYCNRVFTDATAAILFESFPSGKNPLSLPLPNLVSVDAVSYIDDDHVSQAVTGTVFNAEFQYLWPATSWPSDTVQGVRVAVTCGEPTETMAFKQAMLLFITDLYEYRGDLTEKQVYDNLAATTLLQPYRVEMGI